MTWKWFSITGIGGGGGGAIPLDIPGIGGGGGGPAEPIAKRWNYHCKIGLINFLMLKWNKHDNLPVSLIPGIGGGGGIFT